MWPKFVLFMLLGYVCLTKSFAYLGVPQLKIFIGEIALGAFLVARPSAVFGPWFRGLIRRTPLTAVAWGAYAFLAYGIFEVLRGLSLGYPLLSALQNVVFNYYALFLFLGLWIGNQDPTALPRYLRLLAWCNGVYGLMYILILSHVRVSLPWAPEVPLFGQAGGSAIAILGLLATSRNLGKDWPLLFLNAFVLLAVQVRSDWVGISIGLILWGVATKRIGRVIQIVGFGAVMLAVAYAVNFSVPAPATRGGEVSARSIIGRAIAPISSDLAAKYTPEAEVYAGTVSWRTEWWNAIWSSVHADPVRAVVGHGYGFPLWKVVDYVNPGVRTPHSVFYYALGYSGWLGVFLFFSFQLLLARLLWRAYLISGQPFGMMYWGLGMAAAFFGNYFETPFGAAPFYLLVGMSAAPVLMSDAATFPSTVLTHVPKRSVVARAELRRRRERRLAAQTCRRRRGSLRTATPA